MRLTRFSSDQRGVAAVEFALVLPLLLVLLAGAVETKRLWQASRAVNTLAAQAALVMADCIDTAPGSCAKEPQRILDAIAWLAPNLDRALLRVEAIEFTRTSGGSKVLSGSAALGQEIGIDTVGPFRDGQTAVVARVQYTHLPTVFRNFVKEAVPETLRFSVTAFALKS